MTKENEIEGLLYTAAMKSDLPKLNQFLNTYHYRSGACAIAVLHGVIGGNLALIERLLQVPGVKENVAHQGLALEEAAKKGDLAILERILQIPQVQKRAHANFNQALQNASENGHLATVERLLQIPQVQETAHTSFSTTHGHNAALRKAVEKGCLSVINRLLQLPQVKDHAVCDDKNDCEKYFRMTFEVVRGINLTTPLPSLQKGLTK